MYYISLNLDNEVIGVNVRIHNATVIKVPPEKIEADFINNPTRYSYCSESDSFIINPKTIINDKILRAKQLMTSLIEEDIVYNNTTFIATSYEIAYMQGIISKAELADIGDAFKTNWRAKETIIELTLKDLKELVKIHTLRELPIQSAYSIWVAGDKSTEFTYTD